MAQRPLFICIYPCSKKKMNSSIKLPFLPDSFLSTWNKFRHGFTWTHSPLTLTLDFLKKEREGKVMFNFQVAYLTDIRMEAY